MAFRRRPATGGGLLRTAERLGVSRGVVGGSRGWFYVGAGLWTLRKVRELGQGQPEILLSERLHPGERMVIANGVATIERAPTAPVPAGRRGRRAKPGRRARRGRRAGSVELVTQRDLKRSSRRRRRAA